MRLSRFIVVLLTAWVVLLAVAPARAADPFAEAARRLAAALAAQAGNEISVSFANRSSAAEAEFSALRRTMEAQLRAQGLKLLPASPVKCRITLAENAQGYLWVAEVRKGETQSVAIEPVARALPAPPPTAASFVLRKTLLWTQPAPILDVARIDAPPAPRLLVLEPGRVALYGLAGAPAEPIEAQAISRAMPWPRELRGRLLLAPDHLFDAYLPGLHCQGAPSVAGMTCAASDDPWPLDLNLNAFFSGSRNFFTGVLSGEAAQGKNTAPFYAAAKLDEQGAPLWVFTGVDGRVRLSTAAGESTLDFPGWGSDVATVRSTCGSGTQLLASGAGDDYFPDNVRAFELVARQPVAVSQPVEFAGPVTALWPAPGGAIAVSHNLKTGNYEAFSLTVGCER